MLQAKYSENLVIISFPCDSFYQEPGTNETIRDIALQNGTKYIVTQKISCGNTDASHPLFTFLRTRTSTGGLFGGLIFWNFTKFLCDANGIPIRKYNSHNSPLSFENDILSLISKE